MQVFTTFITAVIICSILRAVTDIIMPEGSMKNITDVGINAVIFASLASYIVNFLKGII